MKSMVSYKEVSDIINELPIAIRSKRRSKGLSLRDAAQEIGDIAHTLLGRIENGENYSSKSLIPLLKWLDK